MTSSHEYHISNPSVPRPLVSISGKLCLDRQVLGLRWDYSFHLLIDRLWCQTYYRTTELQQVPAGLPDTKLSHRQGCQGDVSRR